MTGAYTSDGRRRSSMAHAKHGHTCDLCGTTVFGNGAKVSHGRKHVRAGEAVELMRDYGPPAGVSRFFLAPDDPRIPEWEARGFDRVKSR